MITFSYMLGCRDCLNGSNHRHLYLLVNGNVQEYQNMTEFEVMKKIEKWRLEKNLTCQFCGSSNVEVMEIEVDGYPLYDYSRLVRRAQEKNMSESEDENIYMLNLDKSNSRIIPNVGGNNQVHKDFLQKSLLQIINTVNERPISNFKAHRSGNFFISITGGFDFNQRRQVVKVERFRSVGLSKDEIIETVHSLAARYNISFFEGTKIVETPKKKSWWNW